jgi:hypothetical protein
MRATLLYLFPILLYGELLYSIQLATFMSREDALNGIPPLQVEREKLFLYRTDRGYWTVRTELSKSYNDLKKSLPLSKNRYIRRGIVVATSSKKVEWLEKKSSEERVKSTVLSSLNEILQSSEESEKVDKPTPNREEVFVSRMRDLQKRDSKIESFTFYIKTKHIFYVVQFGEYPFSESANQVYNEKPRIKQDSSITVSNGNGTMIIRFNTLEDSEKVEESIKRVINISRRTENIRIKAYRIKSR